MECLWAFVDESGDMGFKPNSSRYATFAGVVTSSRFAVERIPGRIRKRRLKRNIRRLAELKFHNSNREVRMAVLRMLAATGDTSVACLVVDKSKLRKRFQEHNEEFYVGSCVRLAEEIASLARPGRSLSLVFDLRRGGGIMNSAFESAVLGGVVGTDRSEGKTPPEIRVSKLDSLTSGGLQVADYVAGAIQRRFEREDDQYYRVVEPMIVARLDESAL